MSADERVVTIWGPFTDADLTEIVAVVRAIEQRRPVDTFSVLVNDQQSIEEAKAQIARINPLRPGYVRTVEVMPFGGDE